MQRTLILITMLLTATLSAPAKSTTTHKSRTSHTTTAARTPVVAYTLAGCPDCAAFKQFLRAAGVHTTTQYTRENRVSLYPTVVYSDGRTDNGERVYARQVKLPKSLTLIETD